MFPLVAGSAAATAALEQADVQTNEENVSERVARVREGGTSPRCDC